MVTRLHNRTSKIRLYQKLFGDAIFFILLYKLNETAQVKINTPYRDTENIEIKEVVKQGTTY